MISVCGGPAFAHKQQVYASSQLQYARPHAIVPARRQMSLCCSSGTRICSSNRRSRPTSSVIVLNRHNSGNGSSSSKQAEADQQLLRMLGVNRTPTTSTTSSSSSSRDSDLQAIPTGFRNLRQGIIDPNNPWYKAWRGLLIGAAAFTGVFVPWELGFGDWSHFYTLDNWATWLDVLLVMLFMADIGVSHFVAYEADELLVDEAGAIAANYRRQRLALDFISAFPFDWVAYAVAAAAAAAVVAAPETAGSLPDQAAAVAGSGDLASTSAAAAAAAAVAAAGGGGGILPAAASLKALHLVRLYRVRWFFRYLEYDLTMSLLSVTVARNLVIVLYLTHWVACGFDFMARSEGYDPDLLVGLNSDLFSSVSGPEQYLYSLYWSVTTLAGNEWNGMDEVTDMRQVVANTYRASVFLLFNIALGAYILGTITLLVVKNDERTGRYRDLSTNLRTYSVLNQLPAQLKDEMQEHLRLQFNHQEASDEQVLSIYPTTIRRRILRHLYLRHLRASYLFRGAPRKYLDALLSASRLELFRPGVDLLGAGDSVNELFIVVAGKVELRSPLDPSVSQYDWGGDFSESMTSADPLHSMLGELDPDDDIATAATTAGLGLYAGAAKALGPGELFGEISFFTEIPQMETVRSVSTVRVMVISRSAFEAIERNFPIATRLVLENLRRHSELQVCHEFPGMAVSRLDLQSLLAACPSSLMYSWASPELVELMTGDDADPDSTEASPYSTIDSSSSSSSSSSLLSTDDIQLPPQLALSTAAAAAGIPLLSSVSGSSKLSARQELVLSNLVRVMAVINQHLAKQDEDRTTDFLYAATRGDVVKLRAMLQQGFNPDSADYDGRTALMLACVRGHRDVADLLLTAGANARLIDNMGRSALLEACYHGHDILIDILAASGIQLTMAGTPVSDFSSSSSSSSSASRMVTSGSSASNISGSNSLYNRDAAAAGYYGSLSTSSSSSLDQAAAAAAAGHSGSDASWGLQLASLLCNCVYECNLPLLRRLLRAGAPVDIGDYDRRTALHISAAEGNLVMLRVLVEEGCADLDVQDRWGYTPLDEARRVGAQMVVRYLETAGAAAAAAAAVAGDGQSSAAAAAAGDTDRGMLTNGFKNHNSPGGLRSSFTGARANGSSSSSSSKDRSGSSQHVQAAAAAAAADLQRQQQQQARAVRSSLNSAQAPDRLSRGDAVKELVRMAEEAHKQLRVTAASIDADLAQRNAERSAADERSLASSSSSSSSQGDLPVEGLNSSGYGMQQEVTSSSSSIGGDSEAGSDSNNVVSAVRLHPPKRVTGKSLLSIPHIVGPRRI